VIRRNSRRLALMTSLLLVLAVGGQPALASTFISGTGKWGAYNVFDTSGGPQGGRCVHKDSGIHKLLKIKVRPPTIFGFYETNSWVGWRYKIFRRGASGSWSSIFKSSIHKDRARETAAADDFNMRTWLAPTNPSGGYKVRIVMFWYVPGSQTSVEGKVVVEYDWYRSHLKGDAANWYLTEDYCRPTAT